MYCFMFDPLTKAKVLSLIYNSMKPTPWRIKFIQVNYVAFLWSDLVSNNESFNLLYLWFSNPHISVCDSSVILFGFWYFFSKDTGGLNQEDPWHMATWQLKDSPPPHRGENASSYLILFDWMGWSSTSAVMWSYFIT